MERFDRKPPVKSIVRKVADAYETLGMLEDKERILRKYNDLLMDTNKGSIKKSRNASSKKKKKSGLLLKHDLLWFVLNARNP